MCRPQSIVRSFEWPTVVPAPPFANPLPCRELPNKDCHRHLRDRKHNPAIERAHVPTRPGTDVAPDSATQFKPWADQVQTMHCNQERHYTQNPTWPRGDHATTPASGAATSSTLRHRPALPSNARAYRRAVSRRGLCELCKGRDGQARPCTARGYVAYVRRYISYTCHPMNKTAPTSSIRNCQFAKKRTFSELWSKAIRTPDTAAFSPAASAGCSGCDPDLS